MPTMEFNVGSPLMQVAAVVIIAGLINAGYWYQLDKDKRVIAEQMQRAEAKNRELAEIKVRYLDRQKQAESYKRRVDVIDQLRNNQTGPVTLLAMVGDTVNNTEAVWLNSMQDQGANVAIDGTALSSDAVANLITNLQKTGYFRNIEIKESVQDDSIKDMQAFQFTLTCEKAKS
ncbi:MAG: PilN domain-containing protein [Terriglobales bacterium]